MMEADFLHAILEHPEDEVSRLAFADWLMERGDQDSTDRGEFIQVQIQLARRTENGGNPSEWVDTARLPQLRAREKALLAAHGAQWAKPVANLVDAYQYHKGFIEQVTLDGNKLLHNGDLLFGLAPVQRVRLSGGLTKKVADCPCLQKITGLDLSRTHIGDAGLRLLLDSPHLQRLNWLDLSHCYLTNRGAQALADSPLLGQLQHLNLGNNVLGQPAVQVLFASPHLRKIKTLLLTGNYRIDTRAQSFLTQTLQGTPDPALLRSILHMASREERTLCNVHVREVAQRAGRDPSAAVGVLREALGDGRRKVRSAAAQMVAQLGARGATALPSMVQRLYENRPATRDSVAPALARLAQDLPAELQRWLCLLANPLLSASANLRVVLDHGGLSAAVRQEFALVCARRHLWWANLLQEARETLTPPAPGTVRMDLPAITEAVNHLLGRAARHAGRHAAGEAKQNREAAGRNREAAWLLARLTELLQATIPAEPTPPQARKRKQKKE